MKENPLETLIGRYAQKLIPFDQKQAMATSMAHVIASIGADEELQTKDQILFALGNALANHQAGLLEPDQAAGQRAIDVINAMATTRWPGFQKLMIRVFMDKASEDQLKGMDPDTKKEINKIFGKDVV